MKYKAEIFDYLQYLYSITGFNDHQLHCVIQFQNKLDTRMLEKSIRLLVKAIPILTRVYINKNGSSYWEDVDEYNINALFTIVQNIEEFDRFTYSKTIEDLGPQIKVCLLEAKKDSLSIVMNHMVTDGAGFKQCLYLFADIYSKLMKNPRYLPDYEIDGERSFEKVLTKFQVINKMKALVLNRKDSNQRTDYQFPFSSEEHVTPFIMTHTVLPERYEKLQSFCKENKFTVNDVLLTAYFRVLSDMLGAYGKELSLPIMIDMRKYLKDYSFNAVTNLTSTSIINMVVNSCEDFNKTLLRVRGIMKRKKLNNFGINTFMKLDLIFKIGKNNLGYKLLKKSLKNPKICMTNIGVFDRDKLNFYNATIENAYICGSIKYRPHFQMAVSTFDSKMTFTVNLYGSQEDRLNIEKFFDKMEKELSSIR